MSQKERQARSRLKLLLGEPGILRASLIEMKRRCGNTYCRCVKAKRHWHLSWYAGQSRGGKKRMKCIPSDLVEEVRHWVERYREVSRLLDEVSDENWSHLLRRAKPKR